MTIGRRMALVYPEDIGEGFLCISIGLEDAEDLVADLAQTLAKLP